MSKNTSFSLGDHFSDFVDRQILSGRYGSASDVIRAGLRLLEDQEVKLKALRAALIEGEESGEPMAVVEKNRAPSPEPCSISLKTNQEGRITPPHSLNTNNTS